MIHEHQWNEEDIKLLKNHAKAIVHMRNQFQNKRFGLIFGSGINKPIGFPNWKELIIEVANDSEVDGIRILESERNENSQTSCAEMLFQHFRDCCYKRKYSRGCCPSIEEEELEIKRNWREIIHRNLYKSAKDPERIKNEHPYMKEYLEIIKESQLTVNYNFDDTIEQMLAYDRTENEKTQSRGYETVWHPRMQYKSDKAVIYHPNGFLPRNLLENPSENLVFSEDEFADQLISSMAGHYASLLHHLSKNTCLLIGLSLEDSTLRHLLRQSSLINPGNYHYYVAHINDTNELDQGKCQAIINTNFEVYNLITLFLTDDGIKALARLIKLDKISLKQKGQELGVNLVYIYYITGVIGVGKTTSVSYLRNLITYDEWFEPRLELLNKQFTDLSPEERDTVDSWIARQFYLKNKNLLETGEGLHIIDRCPLDPISFTLPNEMPKKADLLLDTIIPGSSANSGWRIVPGHIILLIGDEKQIKGRLSSRHKKASQNYIKDMQKNMKKLCGTNTTIVDTRGLSIEKMVKRIAQTIHMGEYVTTDIQSCLEELRNDG
jgi:hypothetical protein